MYKLVLLEWNVTDGSWWSRGGWWQRNHRKRWCSWPVWIWIRGVSSRVSEQSAVLMYLLRSSSGKRGDSFDSPSALGKTMQKKEHNVGKTLFRKEFQIKLAASIEWVIIWGRRSHKEYGQRWQRSYGWSTSTSDKVSCDCCLKNLNSVKIILTILWSLKRIKYDIFLKHNEK